MTARPEVEWVSVRRAGDLLGCSPQTVWRMIGEGTLIASTVHTVAGLARTIVAVDSVERERGRRNAA